MARRPFTFYNVASLLYFYHASKQKLREATFVRYLRKFNNSNPAGNYMFRVKKRSTSTKCKICLKLTIKTAERRQWCLNIWTFFTPCSSVSTVNFEQENAGGEILQRQVSFF